MKPLIPTLAAAALALAAAVSFAQAPGGGPATGPMGGPGIGGHRMVDCSKAQDPAQCESRRAEMEKRRGQMHEAMKSAYASCKDKPDRRACMREQMCAKSPDPAKCQARAQERQQRMSQRMDERQKAHEACTGKRGEELMNCLGEQRGHRHGTKPQSRG